MLSLWSDPILFSRVTAYFFPRVTPYFFHWGTPYFFSGGNPLDDRAWAFPNLKLGGNVIPYLVGGIQVVPRGITSESSEGALRSAQASPPALVGLNCVLRHDRKSLPMQEYWLQLSSRDI